MENRRQFSRLKVDELQSTCRIKGSKLLIHIDISDLSPNGIGFVSNEGIVEGQELDIELKLEKEKVLCRAKVCWIKPDVIDRRMSIGGMRLLIPNLHDQSKLLVSYTNRLLEECPLPQSFAI